MRGSSKGVEGTGGAGAERRGAPTAPSRPVSPDWTIRTVSVPSLPPRDDDHIRRILAGLIARPLLSEVRNQVGKRGAND